MSKTQEIQNRATRWTEVDRYTHDFRVIEVQEIAADLGLYFIRLSIPMSTAGITKLDAFDLAAYIGSASPAKAHLVTVAVNYEDRTRLCATVSVQD